jgi:hypothetical protein
MIFSADFAHVRRALYEGLVCVAAGAMQTGASREGASREGASREDASKSGRCTMKDVYSIVERMRKLGIQKDVETYNALLLAMAGKPSTLNPAP